MLSLLKVIAFIHRTHNVRDGCTTNPGGYLNRYAQKTGTHSEGENHLPISKVLFFGAAPVHDNIGPERPPNKDF